MLSIMWTCYANNGFCPRLMYVKEDLTIQEARDLLKDRQTRRSFVIQPHSRTPAGEWQKGEKKQMPSIHSLHSLPLSFVPSTIPNISVFNSLLSSILHTWQNNWEFPLNGSGQYYAGSKRLVKRQTLRSFVVQFHRRTPAGEWRNGKKKKNCIWTMNMTGPRVPDYPGEPVPER